MSYPEIYPPEPPQEHTHISDKTVIKHQIHFTGSFKDLSIVQELWQKGLVPKTLADLGAKETKLRVSLIPLIKYFLSTTLYCNTDKLATDRRTEITTKLKRIQSLF